MEVKEIQFPQSYLNLTLVLHNFTLKEKNKKQKKNPKTHNNKKNQQKITTITTTTTFGLISVFLLFFFCFQNNHYFESTYDSSYNVKPYEVPKELKHLKGEFIVYSKDQTTGHLNLYQFSGGSRGGWGFK